MRFLSLILVALMLTGFSKKPEVGEIKDEAAKTEEVVATTASTTENAEKPETSQTIYNSNDKDPLYASDIVLGDKNAPLLVIEYASYTCPHCGRFHKETFPMVQKEYIDTGKVRFVLRESPGDNAALLASMVGRCLPEGRFYDWADLVFEKQDAWIRSQDPLAFLKNMAAQMGIGDEKFETCAKDEKVLDTLRTRVKEAIDVYGVSGTPAFRIYGKTHGGFQNIDAMRKILDDALSSIQ